MKETKNINLAGCALVMDEDAAQVLRQYLCQIEGHLQESDSKEEILQDIEARVVELLRQHLNYGHAEVVDIHMVEDVKRQLGTPEVITEGEVTPEEKKAEKSGEEDSVEDAHAVGEDEAESAYSQIAGGNRNTKRLYRDIEDQKVAGVCAGIAKYLDVDAFWLRLILLISIFFYGSGVMLYIVLWIIIPEANTTARKLEQQGIDPSAENIRQEVERQKEYQIQHPHVRQNNGGSGVARGCLIVLALLAAFPLLVVVFVIMVMTFGLSIAAAPLSSLLAISMSSIFGAVGMIICGLMIFIIPIVVLIVWSRNKNNSDKPLSKWFWIVALLLWLGAFVGTNCGGWYMAKQVHDWDQEAFEMRMDSIVNAWGYDPQVIDRHANELEQLLDSLDTAWEQENQ